MDHGLSTAPSFDYTANYCEENIYCLVQKFLSDEVWDRTTWQIYAVVVSNASKCAVLWNQRSSTRPEHGMPVFWDYHVIAVIVHRETKSERKAWIYDFDTVLPNPCSFFDYVEGTFRPSLFASQHIPEDYASKFRVVPGEEFISEFASDRSHMLSTVSNGSNLGETSPIYKYPSPNSAVIQGPSARARGATNNLMSEFVAMDVAGVGEVMTLEAFLTWGTMTEPSPSHMQIIPLQVPVGPSSRRTPFNLARDAEGFSRLSPYAWPMSTLQYGEINGHELNGISNGVPGPSKPPIVRLPTPSTSGSPTSHNGIPASPTEQRAAPGSANNNACLEHLYQNGFRLGHWADTVLHIQGHAYNMHALLLGRSPYLAHLMSTTPLVQSNGTGPLRSIYVPIEHDPEITPEAFILAVGYLYSSIALSGISSANARAVLAAGCLLGGMDDLCNLAYETCRASISVNNIKEWLHFIQQLEPREDPGSRSGRVTPVSPPPQSPAFRGPFMTYALRLREDVMNFLIVDLPTQVNAFRPDSPTDANANAGQTALMQIYSDVPFDIFKKAIESPAFRIGSDQARFRFAKSTIEQRKKPGRIAYMANAEETVVLAFGATSGAGAGGSAVHITRKVKKRPLWKVSA